MVIEKIKKKSQTKIIKNDELNWNAGHLPVVICLVEHGANIKVRDMDGLTAEDSANATGSWQCQFE